MRLAEELAMIDMISKGRLVSGFVRGGGQEQLATGVNPAFNRERFEEAHDLVVAAWTAPGPVPLGGHALPAPRRQSVGGAAAEALSARLDPRRAVSQETIIWAAKQRYPYIALNTSIEATKKIWKIYDEAALETGYEAGPENRGYLQQVHVSDSEEKAEKNARQFLWMQGEFTGLAHPVWANPSGYFSPTLRRNFVEFAVGRAENPRGRPTFEQQVADGRVFFGTPKTVIPKLRRVLEETRPSIYGIWGNDGTVSDEDARTCIRLLGQEVMPAMREIGKELGLKDPFETQRAGASQILDRPQADAAGRGIACLKPFEPFVIGSGLVDDQSPVAGAAIFAPLRCQNDRQCPLTGRFLHVITRCIMRRIASIPISSIGRAFTHFLPSSRIDDGAGGLAAQVDGERDAGVVAPIAIEVGIRERQEDRFLILAQVEESDAP